MNSGTQYFSLEGAAGKLECARDLPDQNSFPAPRGIALIGHPHPLFGGTMDNKIVVTLARTFNGLGYVTFRMNFRGVGSSEGTHDEGRGEADDMMLLYEYARREYPDLPVALSGFSFGTYIQTQLFHRLSERQTPPERMVLVGAAAGKWNLPAVPADTIVIHGEEDDTIPLSNVMDWARPQDLPVIVIPGADHFFHRRLHHIKNIVTSLWKR